MLKLCQFPPNVAYKSVMVRNDLPQLARYEAGPIYKKLKSNKHATIHFRTKETEGTMKESLVSQHRGCRGWKIMKT